jgi:cytochrome c-type biogenesis protein CcmH/NrfG
MSARNRKLALREKSYDEEPPYTGIVLAIMMLMIGVLAGYALSLPPRPIAGGPTPAAPTPAPPNTMVADENALSAYRDMLARDPKNVQAAISAGNLLYDAKRYAEAVPFYRQAMALDPQNVNVSTDLGTALWYSGHADEALAQYARSLSIDARHAQTLFNMGIVRSEGKRDYPGAAAAWEQLLASNPSYPNAASVRSMIDEARMNAFR